MSRRSSPTSVALWLAALVALLLVTVSLSRRERPYALDSVDDQGYRGLVLLLENYGATVTEADIDDLNSGSLADTDVVLVTSGSTMSSDAARRLWSHASAGHRVVAGDGLRSVGDFGGLEPADVDIFDAPFGTQCTMADLADIADIADIQTDFGATYFDVTTVDESCLGDARLAAVARVAVGEGDVIGISTPAYFTNTNMGAPPPGEPPPGESDAFIPDNAALAQRLLASEGVESVAIIRSPSEAVGAVGGEKGIGDFMSLGVKLALAQLVVAFGIFAWFRGRRHGRPVVESQPVGVASSELVDAVGNLLERQSDPTRAGNRIRHRVVRELQARLSLPPDTTVDVLARLLATRTGGDAHHIHALLAEGPLADDRALITLTRQLDEIRQEALDDRVPAQPAG